MGGADVRVTLDARDFQPGDQVTGTIAIGPDISVRAARAELREINRFNGQRSTVAALAGLAESGDSPAPRTGPRIERVAVSVESLPADQGEHQFNLTLPDNAPPSAEDQMIPDALRELVSWQVCAVVDGAWPTTQTAGEEIRVRSRSGQYGGWAKTDPVVSAPDCPIGVWPDRRQLRPGESLAGTVVVAPRRPVTVESVYVALERRRIDSGLPDPTTNHGSWNHVSRELSGPTELAPGERYDFPFELSLPADAPPSFIARHNSLHWFLVGGVDRGAFHSRYSGEAEVVVYTGEEGGAPVTATDVSTATELDDLMRFVTAPPPPDAAGNQGLERKKMEAARDIARSGDPGALDALIKLLDVETGYVPHVKEQKATLFQTVVEALAASRDPRGLEAMRQKLAERSHEDREKLGFKKALMRAVDDTALRQAIEKAGNEAGT